MSAVGVMDAVQKGYLKNMYFGIAQDAEATNLLEVNPFGTTQESLANSMRHLHRSVSL